MSSLGFRPVSWMIRILRRTFRVSFQCHRIATDSSSALSKLYKRKASSGSESAEGAGLGKQWKRSKRSGGSVSINEASSSDVSNVGDVNPSSLSTEWMFFASRFGKSKC